MKEVPIWEKSNLTLEEAAAYSGIGINKLRDLTSERYISLKQGVRYNTKIGYNFVLNLIKKEDFGYRKIRDIKVSDAQQWIMKLQATGKGTAPSPVSGAL